MTTLRETVLPEVPRFRIAVVSFTTPGSPRAYSLASRLRERGVTTLAGGAHPSALPDEVLRHFDAVCVGPGDAQLSQMVRDAEQGELLRVYRGATGEWVLPRSGPRRRITVLQLSRGCEYRCPHCSVPVLFPDGCDRKPHEMVAREVDEEGPVLSLVDDTFTPASSWGREVLEIIARAGKRFVCQVRPETALDGVSVPLLARHGCVLVGVGLESPLAGSRRLLGKPSTAEPAEVVRSIQRTGTGCYLNLVFGSDGETPEVFRSALRLIAETKPALVSPHLLTPFPGTALRDRLARERRLLHREEEFPDAWALHTTRRVCFAPDPMTPDELQGGFDRFCAELFSLRRTLRDTPARFLAPALILCASRGRW